MPPPITAVLLGFLLGFLIVLVRTLLEWRRSVREVERLEKAADQLISGVAITDLNGEPADAAYERRVRNALAHAITVSYVHPDGTSSEVKLDPTSVDSIEKFLKTVREDSALRGRQGEPATSVR